MSDELYYIQDSRPNSSNSVYWWAKNSCGYTDDLSKAEIYTKRSAYRQHISRKTDIPWPKKYVDGKSFRTVDVGSLNMCLDEMVFPTCDCCGIEMEGKILSSQMFTNQAGDILCSADCQDLSLSGITQA